MSIGSGYSEKYHNQKVYAMPEPFQIAEERHQGTNVGRQDHDRWQDELCDELILCIILFRVLLTERSNPGVGVSWSTSTIPKIFISCPSLPTLCTNLEVVDKIC